MNTILRAAAVLALTSAVAFFAGQTRAATLAAWEVSNVPRGDTHNVRKYPPGASHKQVAYPNRTML